VRVELVYFTGCPNVPPMRELLRRCLAQIGVSEEVFEINTDTATVPESYRQLGSPTVLVDGVDVLGNHSGGAESCRLQLPTEAQLMAALGGRHEE
jgi:hypothetical protein